MERNPKLRWVRFRLRRSDGEIYLDRWGFSKDSWGGIFLHRMKAPDPGIDLHDHPWWFASLVLKGGYVEERADTRVGVQLANYFERFKIKRRGNYNVRLRWSVQAMRLDECHRITQLLDKTVWTLVIHGPRKREWGFYLPTGWMEQSEYDREVRTRRGDLIEERF